MAEIATKRIFENDKIAVWELTPAFKIGHTRSLAPARRCPTRCSCRQRTTPGGSGHS